MTSAVERTATGASHAYIDHTSGVTIQLRAPTWKGLVSEAALAFTGLVPGRLLGAPAGEWKTLRLQGRDRSGVLVDFLNDLIYLAEVEAWVPEETHVECDGERSEAGREISISERARGRSLLSPFVLVKAATLHRAAVREGPEGCIAEVTLDI